MPSSVSTRRRRRKPVDDEQKENRRLENLEQENSIISDDGIEILCNPPAPGIADFERAAKSSASASFWKKHGELKEVVLHLSADGSSSQGLLLLQEHATSLLRECRKCIKEATEQSKWSQGLFFNIYVATHGLRALLLVENEADTILKLLYHALVTLSDRLTKLTNSVVDDGAKVAATSVALYEAQSRLFQRVVVENLQFVLGDDRAKARLCFPLPVEATNRDDTSKIPSRQIFKIALQSTLAVCNVVWRYRQSLSKIKKTKPSSTEGLSEFGTRFADVLTAVESKHELALLLIDVTQYACLPWLQAYVHRHGSCEEAVPLAKAAHRLLWEVAASFTKAAHTCLELRRHAILALLAANDAACTDMACTYAWKAAVTHGQQQHTDKDEALLAFHKSVGDALDRSQRPHKEFNMAYIEYCVYRAVHIKESELDAVTLRVHDKISSNPKIMPLSTVDRLAKLAFSEGKKRNEAGNPSQAAVLLSVSLKLFALVESITNEPTHVASNRLVSRCSYTASVLTSLEQLEAARLAIIASLAYYSVESFKVQEQYEDEPLASVALCNILKMSRGVGVWDDMQSTMSLIRRLITCIDNQVGSDTSEESKKLSLVSIADRVLRHVRPSDTDKEQNVTVGVVESHLVGVFSDILTRSSSKYRDGILLKQLRLAALVVIATGNAMMKSKTEDKSFERLQKEFRFFPRLLIRLLKNICGTDNYVSWIDGMAYYLAASSIECQDVEAEHLSKLHFQLLERAMKSFRAAASDEECEYTAVASSCLIDCLHKKGILVKNEGELQAVERAVKQFLDTQKSGKLFEEACQVLRVSLSSMRADYVFSGDHIKASKVAHWNLLLSKKWSETGKADLWHATGVITSLTKAGIPDLSESLVTSRYPPTTKDIDLVGIDYCVANARQQMTTSTKSIAKKNLGQQINRARDRLEGGFEKSMLSLWVNSSVSLGLAELYASQMMLSFSLSSAKDCIKYCQLGMKESRKMRGDQIDGASLSLLLPKLFSERKVTCLLHMSSIHDALGSYRKAEAYLLTALTQSGIGFSSRIDRLDLQSVSILCREVENVQQMLGYRAVVALKAQLHSYPKLKAALWKAIDSRDKNFDPHDDLELSLGRIQLISDFVSRIDLGSIVAEETQLINQAIEVVTRCDLVVSNDFVSSFLPSGGIALDRNIFSNVIGEVTLCQVQLLLLECQGSSIVKAEEMCNNVLATSTNATLKCRAHNYLGLIRLMAARESGSLLLVWSESLPLTDDLIAAADHFEAALELVDSLDFVSKREISRSLALSLGPNHRSKRLGLSSDALIFSSIGVAMTVKLFDTAGDEQGSERSLGIAEIFGTAQSELPPEWRIVSAALCSTGELLVASLKNGESECACVFPARYQDKMFDSSIYDFMMSPLDELIQRSERQLNGMDEAKISVKYSDASSKRDWWSKREELDEGLDDLLGRVHSVYFGNSRIGSIFGGMECNEDETSVLSPNGNLETKFDAAFDLNSDRGMNADECTILLLDENLHRFPWEGLPFLRGKPITRVPSLSFLSSRARNYSRHKVDATNARYVLDPESNLGHTTGRIMPFIECVNERTGWSWSGVVGEFPSDEFVAESLARENGMFLYCGHGGGKGTFSKSKIDSLVNENHMLPFQATVILMGCSSGKLESVNRKEGEAFKSVPIHYEPEGIALSYILAGAPCVVGNLWDVTDRDIDRFCLTLLGSFLSNGDASLARCLANARSSCKMQHIVGLAPVCYGIPVYLMDDMQTSSSG